MEFKADAVKIATRPGMIVAQAARDLGIGDTLLRAWIDKARAELGSAAISGTSGANWLSSVVKCAFSKRNEKS